LADSLQTKPKAQKSDTEKIRDFQRKLYLKAKQEKEFRFYVLYDKVRDIGFLREAYRRVKENKGAAGVDHVTFADIEQKGIEEFLDGIKQELETKTYKPSPVLRVYIPKANGKLRPLGIPTIKDRVVQMACKMVIEPIFEADFEDSSYGFRPKRSAKNAISEVKKNLQAGKHQIFDADLQSYFDSIPHDKLMIILGKRISDRNVLHLIKMWLKSPVIEDGKISGGKKNKQGTPQGGVISPLLSNIYLHLLDRIVNQKDSVFSRYGVKIIRYADDYLLIGKRIPDQVSEYMKKILSRMELKLNEEKSKLVDARETSFDFLGFTVRYDCSRYAKERRYWNVIPSKKAEKKFRSTIDTYLKKSLHLGEEELVKGLNEKIRGWVNYYTIPGVSYMNESRQKLSYYLGIKLQWYYQRKSQRKSKLSNQKAIKVLIKRYGLLNMAKSSISLHPVNALR
jgi:RNA-directed DNA polymerase